MPKNKCQSCSMPLKKDPNLGGTESNGSKSSKYCSLCYVNGEFIGNMTKEEMMVFVENILVEKRIPRFLAKIMAKQIPKLERWNK